jgi:hypothetical protein
LYGEPYWNRRELLRPAGGMADYNSVNRQPISEELDHR